MENLTSDEALAALERIVGRRDAEVRRLTSAIDPSERRLVELERLRGEVSALESSVRGLRATIAQEIAALARETGLIRALGASVPAPSRIDYQG